MLRQRDDNDDKHVSTTIMMNRDERRGRGHERVKRQNPRQVQPDGTRQAPLACVSWPDMPGDVAANLKGMAILIYFFLIIHAKTGGCSWQVNKGEA